MRSEIQVSSIAKHFRISASLSYFKRTRILSVGTVHITPPLPIKKRRPLWTAFSFGRSTILVPGRLIEVTYLA
jgi:hypothetical protein